MHSGPMKLKVCFIGEAAVGKTSLIRKFVHDQFSDEYHATMGAKISAKDVVVKSPERRDFSVKMMIWDIIGETSIIEEYGQSYFFGAQGIIAVCDLTRFSTFERLPIWLSEVQRFASGVPMALAVNKNDLKAEVLVLYDEFQVRQFADSVGARLYMTSAKTGENVELMFARLAEDILNNMKAQSVSVPLATPRP